LSQVYPLPQKSWDRLSATSAIGSYDGSAAARTSLPDTSPAQYTSTNPGTASSGALGVAQYLNSQSQDLTTYSSNPLWQVVDGPFRLTQYTTSGFVKMVPNRSYSGKPKPTISAFEELPFTTDTAEFDALRTGSLTIGYIPSQDLD
jgi:peptide/nickel transport system substrate-binding protein